MANIRTRSDPKGRVYWFELLVAGLGMAACLLLTFLFWRGLALYQSIWLLPGLYFVELSVGSVICFIAFLMQHSQAGILAWIFSGIVLVFSVLASFTVGIFYMPVFLIFLGLALYSVIRQRQNWLVRLIIFALSMIFQLAVMLLMIRFLN